MLIKSSMFTILENSSLFVNINTLYLLYFIMSLLSHSKLAEQVARETALIMLESPHRDESFGNLDAWEYMETYLCGEKDYQACVHYLRGEAQALAILGLELIRVGSLGSEELLALLCNNEPNAGVGSNNPVKRVEDSGFFLRWVVFTFQSRKYMVSSNPSKQ